MTTDNRPPRSVGRHRLLAQITDWQDQAKLAREQADRLGEYEFAAKGLLLGKAKAFLQCADDLRALLTRTTVMKGSHDRG